MAEGYESFLEQMKQGYQQRTGIPVDSASDVGIRFAVLAEQLALLQQELVRQLRLVVQQLLKLVARRQEVPPLQVQQQAELLPVAQLLQEEQGVQLLVVVASLSWEA